MGYRRPPAVFWVPARAINSQNRWGNFNPGEVGEPNPGSAGRSRSFTDLSTRPLPPMAGFIPFYMEKIAPPEVSASRGSESG